MVRGEGGGASTSCSFSGFWCEATKPRFIWRKVETVRAACVIGASVTKTSPFLFLFFLNYVFTQYLLGSNMSCCHEKIPPLLCD